ncbi:MAG: acetylxylan esterase [Planctomycetota bacterium]
MYIIHLVRTICLLLTIISTGAAQVHAQKKFVPNYDESKVPEFDLPPIFKPSSQDPISEWADRRTELLSLFQQQVYGLPPTHLAYRTSYSIVESGPGLAGKALRQQIRIKLETDAANHTIDLLVYTPAEPNRPVPLFLGLNFFGNHTVSKDPQIAITSAWSRNSAEKGVSQNKATDKGRGTAASRWPIEKLIENGLGVATCYCGDIDPDFDDQFQNGVHSLFPQFRPGPDHPDRWGTIAAWAWGLSRLLDGLIQKVPQVDPNRVVVIGHSRLGKTSLWAAASDTRFAGAISNNSGCGGAALSRRRFGETVGRINQSFPHWFCENFKQYNRNEDALPLDQHQLLSLIARRPIYIASASEDRWADPRGEFLSAKSASQLYSNLGYPELKLSEFPEPGTHTIGPVSYHLRKGRHNITDWDWDRYIEFMRAMVQSQ